MRSYIFTERERKIILDYLYMSSEKKSGDIKHIKSRVRHFNQLPTDLDLYLRLKEAMRMDKEFFESSRTHV
jgi:hypothetical protein